MEDRNSINNGPAIRIENITKFYGQIRGVENVNLEVESGVIHGFLGPNGAGKTTTIRILVGLLRQSSGKALIHDHPAGSVEAKQLIGYLPSDFELYKHYSVREYLNYIETLRGKAPLKDELIERLSLDTTRKTGELSRGNKQKVAIVQALMHEPAIFIADEPTIGLDPLMQEEFNIFLKKYVSNGNTAFISSHILAEVQEICNIITVIKEGSIVSSGNVEQLLSNLPRKAILKVDKNIDVISLSKTINATIGNQTSEKITVYFDYPTVEFTTNLSQVAGILDFFLPEPDLEEYFLSFYKTE